MKKIIILCLLLCTCLMIGCKKDKNYLQVIADSEIFMMEEKAYYVFFVKEDCPHCEEARPELNEYLKIVNDNQDKYKNSRNIYEVCIKTNDDKSVICRAWNSENGGGQGTDNKFYVDGVTKWDDLYIGSTPSLIAIYEVNGVKKAKYLAQGKSKVINYVYDTLNE